MPFAGADSTPQRQISRAELEAHRSAASCWVAFKGRVYDVTSFLPDHPGGPDFILDAAREDGGDVADKMLDPLLHAHSDSAFEMLEAMCIGVLAGAAPEGRKATKGKASDSASKGKSFDEPEDGLRTTHKALGVARSDFVDPYRPMLAQVFSGRYNKKVYLEQVHIPRHVPGSAPIFGNFLEPLTKTPWWAVPLIWIPFGQAHTLYAWYMGVPLASLAFYWACGLLVWSFIEYSLHRWLFHIDTFLPDNRYAVTLHFLAHGIHHFLPMDK